jgi:hypothetical protein
MSQPRRVAFHEAGHAVAVFAQGGRPEALVTNMTPALREALANVERSLVAAKQTAVDRICKVFGLEARTCKAPTVAAFDNWAGFVHVGSVPFTKAAEIRVTAAGLVAEKIAGYELLADTTAEHEELVALGHAAAERVVRDTAAMLVREWRAVEAFATAAAESLSGNLGAEELASLWKSYGTVLRG